MSQGLVHLFLRSSHACFIRRPPQAGAAIRRKMESKLYVGNLSYSTTEDDLRTLFFQAGTVASVTLVKDRDSGQSKGFAFVEMSNQSEAQKAISMFNGFNIGDREMRVKIGRAHV